MNTISPERAAQLKAEAIAARRAAMAPWQRAHADRMAREREVRRSAKAAAKEVARASEKLCKDCGALKPPAAFELLPSGSLRGSCRDCRTAQKVERKREARAAQRETPEYLAELQRKQQEAAQRQAERESAKAEAQLAKLAAEEAERSAELAAALARQRKRADRKRGIGLRPLSPEQQRELPARIAHLTALLMGTNPAQRISDQQSWEAAASELRQLWLQGGDKVCSSCKATVPASAIRPPGPANFYPGKCNSCAAEAQRKDHRRVFGRDHEGPRPILMLDGSTLTIGEFARRHRERERGYPHPRGCRG